MSFVSLFLHAVACNLRALAQDYTMEFPHYKNHPPHDQILTFPPSDAKSSAPSRTLYLYTLAGVVVPAIVPYTKLVMMKLNDRLHAKVTELAGAQPGDGAFEEKGVPQDETVGSMVDKWRRLNAVRAIAGYIGGIAGLIALVWRD